MIDISKATRYIAVAGPSQFTNDEWKKKDPDFVLRPPVHEDYALLKVLHNVRKTAEKRLRVHYFECDKDDPSIPLDFGGLRDTDVIFLGGHGDGNGIYAMGPSRKDGMRRIIKFLTGDGNLKKLRKGKKIVVVLMSCRAGLGLHKTLANELSNALNIHVTVGGAQGFTFGSIRATYTGLNEVLIRGIPWFMEYEKSITVEEAENQTSAREGKTISYQAKKPDIDKFVAEKKELEKQFKDVVAKLTAKEVNKALDEIESRFRSHWSDLLRAQFELYALAKKRSNLEFDMWFDSLSEGYLWTDGRAVTDQQSDALLTGDLLPHNKSLESIR